MINFFWQLNCAMDFDITNKKRAMEEGPDEEFNILEYENLCTLQLTLEEEWVKLEDIKYDKWLERISTTDLVDVREFTNAEQRAINEDLSLEPITHGTFCTCKACYDEVFEEVY